MRGHSSGHVAEHMSDPWLRFGARAHHSLPTPLNRPPPGEERRIRRRQSVAGTKRASNGMGGAGFEPAKAEPPDLQSGPFDRSGIPPDRSESTRLNSSHSQISYAVFCLKKKKNHRHET